jgi:hypothetical protein
MSSPVLALIILGQIVVFQFLSVPFVKGLFAAQLPYPPEGPDGAITDHLGKAKRHRFALGAILLVPLSITFFGLPSDPGMRKLLLAALSLLSSMAFAGASLIDRRALRTFRAQLPDAGVRRASLEPRSPSQWYGRSREIVPVTLVLLTLALAIPLVHRLGHIPTEMWVLQILQAAFVVGALVYTTRQGVAVPNVSSRLALLRDRPEMALEFGEQLAAQEAQYFLAAKIGVALLLGVSTLEAGLKTVGHPAAAVADAVSWVTVGVLVVLYAGFLTRIISLTKSMQRQIGEEVNGES